MQGCVLVWLHGLKKWLVNPAIQSHVLRGLLLDLSLSDSLSPVGNPSSQGFGGPAPYIAIMVNVYCVIWTVMFLTKSLVIPLREFRLDVPSAFLGRARTFERICGKPLRHGKLTPNGLSYQSYLLPRESCDCEGSHHWSPCQRPCETTRALVSQWFINRISFRSCSLVSGKLKNIW